MTRVRPRWAGGLPVIRLLVRSSVCCRQLLTPSQAATTSRRTCGVAAPFPTARRQPQGLGRNRAYQREVPAPEVLCFKETTKVTAAVEQRGTKAWPGQRQLSSLPMATGLLLPGRPHRPGTASQPCVSEPGGPPLGGPVCPRGRTVHGHRPCGYLSWDSVTSSPDGLPPRQSTTDETRVEFLPQETAHLSGRQQSSGSPGGRTLP